MQISILGTRGVPASHGGFETFAQDLALFLVARNHQVTVYCQTSIGEQIHEDTWNGVRRVLIPTGAGSRASLVFDLASVRHASAEPGVILTLGYNTAIFNLLIRLRNRPNLMNMDGVEWRRKKWSFSQRCWLWLNEWAGARISQHLVADHPEIAHHLERHTSSSKITVIPYGADSVRSAPSEPIAAYGLASKNYDLVIARPEPENSILEIVRAHSMVPRKSPLVVLGEYNNPTNEYKQTVLKAASANVLFPGAIYDRTVVEALRFHCRTYIHGHRVGGTNPSLVESLAAGTPILAHDNCYTRWVAGEGARYFSGKDDLALILDSIDENPAQLLSMEQASREQHAQHFTQLKVLSAYERLLEQVASPKTYKESLRDRMQNPVWSANRKDGIGGSEWSVDMRKKRAQS